MRQGGDVPDGAAAHRFHLCVQLQRIDLPDSVIAKRSSTPNSRVRLPRTELRRRATPRDTRPVAIDHLAVAPERPPTQAPTTATTVRSCPAKHHRAS